MRVLLPNRSFRTVALCPLDTRERRKALRPKAVIKTIAGRRRSDFSPPTELFAASLGVSIRGASRREAGRSPVNSYLDSATPNS